jgi:hypothetical protein
MQDCPAEVLTVARCRIPLHVNPVKVMVFASYVRRLCPDSMADIETGVANMQVRTSLFLVGSLAKGESGKREITTDNEGWEKMRREGEGRRG